MRRKFFVITLENGIAVKTALKKWCRINCNSNTSEISHKLYFSLLAEGWKSEVIKNEVILVSPQAMNEETSYQSELVQEEVVEIQNISDTKLCVQNINTLKSTFSEFIDSYNRMKEQGIFRNQKDITGQLGEWVASIIFEAEIALNGINAHWDLKDSQNNKYQVKSHAKALTTLARWSKIEYTTDAPIDFIVIVVFDPNYKLQELYKVPFNEAIKRRTGKFILNWSQITQFKETNLVAKLKEYNLDFIIPN